MHHDSVDMYLSKLREILKAWFVAVTGSQAVTHDLVTEQHGNNNKVCVY